MVINNDPKIIAKHPIGETPPLFDLPPGAPVPPAKGSAVKERTFPTSLSMAEYNRNWKPHGWKIIFIGPTATWRSEWGIWEAIREIVQNALDETEAYEYGFDNMGFFIRDRGRGVGISNFLLGPPKLKEDWSRGKYGEGMKIGGLALLRAGYPVYVETVGKQLHIIFLEQDVDTGTVQSLAALWKEGGTDVGTIWHVIGYKGDDFSDRFAVNLPQEAVIATGRSLVKYPQQRWNQLIKWDFSKEVTDVRGWTTQPAKSRIFARDIYMKDIKSPFSYNLWSFDLAPDRHAPKDDDEMWQDIGRLWSCVSDQDLLETFLKMVSDPPIIECEESRRVNLNWLGEEPVLRKRYSEILIDNREIWQSAWEKVHGADAVIRTNERWDGTVKHLGYKSVDIGYYSRDALDDIIKTDKALVNESQDKLREVQIVPDEQLSPKALSSLKLARALVDAVTHHWNSVNGVYAALIPPASDRVRTAGLYSRVTMEIYIATDQLESGQQTVDTTIHEVAHHTSQAEDSEKEHYLEISRLSGIIVSKVSTGDFNKLIADPDFKW